MKLLISLFFTISLYSQVIDKLVIIVNNVPITSYDISQTEKKFNIDKNQAISYLIDQAVLDSAIKERGIYVDEFDIDNEMANIAKKNGMSLFNFKNYLLGQGKLDNLKRQIKLKLQKDKLLKTLNIKVTEDDVKKYYDSHKDKFIDFTKIKVTKYSSNNKNDLLDVIKNPLSMNQNVEIKDLEVDMNSTNPKLIQFLNQFDEGKFTPIVSIDNKFSSFYIDSKKDKKLVPYKMVEMKIYQALVEKKSANTLQDFIAKSKAKAEIKFLK